MVPNIPYIQTLIKEKGWSQNCFAMRAGVANSSVSRLFTGKRGAGKDLIAGIIRAFPDQPIDKLFFLPNNLPNSKR